MKNRVSFNIDLDLYKNFKIALNLSGETDDEAINSCLHWYINKTFKRKPPRGTSTKEFYKKAVHRIPKWALKPNQYNYKIIKAYFMSIDIAGEATLVMMERLCSNKDRDDLYVPTFKSNYSQMKLDSPMSHGKVFEDDGYNVWIWEEIKETLMIYKNSFYAGED